MLRQQSENFSFSARSIWFSWIVALLVGATIIVNLPQPYLEASRIRFLASFLLVGMALSISSLGCGALVRQRILRSDFWQADIPLGFGIFAFLLCFYIKVTLVPYPFLVILLAFFALGIASLWQQRGDILARTSEKTFPFQLCIVAWILFMTGAGHLGGLFFPPTDFDSGLFHVSFPKIVVEAGHYFNPDWLRVPWHPQLTHTWYIYLLTLLDDRYLKCINFMCFLQIAILFVGGKKADSLCGLLLLTIVSVSPEFQSSISSTSLDAVLVLFVLTAFATILRYFSTTQDFRYIALATLLCGFAGGQKHFGLMFSVPLLGIASLDYLFRSPPQNDSRWYTRIGQLSLLGILFVTIFVPFYLHNITSGNALLFPFFGSKANTYGWTDGDIHDMLVSTIPHWGHRKDLLGYFSIPFDLIHYPHEYQFSRTNGIIDWLISGEMLSLAILAFCTFFIKKLRRVEVIAPLIFLLIAVFQWYRASQVIRYLFPFLLTSALFFAYVLDKILSAERSKRLQLPNLVAAAALLFSFPVSMSFFPPTTKEELTMFNARVSSGYSTYEWLNQRSTPEEEIIHIASPGSMHYFPRLRLCGDWFAKCSFARVLDSYIQFKQWSELADFVRERNARFIMISWKFFDAKATRPAPEDFGKVFPASTLACIDHVFYDGNVMDIFEIKQSCREKP